MVIQGGAEPHLKDGSPRVTCLRPWAEEISGSKTDRERMGFRVEEPERGIELHNLELASALQRRV